MIAIGPDKDGQFHPKAVAELKDVGAWLKLNGRAIYATRPREHDRWREGHPVYYTRNKSRTRVYAILIAWPGPTLHLYTVKPNPGSTIRMIGVDQPLTWRQEGIHLTIDIPENLQNGNNRPCRHAWVVEIEVSE
jgi:alpha-L-fucosidase